MAAPEMGEILRPQHCRLSVSQDRASLALTFPVEGREPLTIALPILGAAGLQHRMAQTLFKIGVRPKPQPGVRSEPQPGQHAAVPPGAGTNANAP